MANAAVIPGAIPNGVAVSRAAIYVRISDDKGLTGLGVARQEQDCRALCERKGWPVAAVYVENDCSATRAGNRPVYAGLVEDIAAGMVDALVAWDVDRLYRHPKELEELFEVCDAAGLRHLATVGGDLDLSTGDGVLVARIKGAVGAEEVRKLVQRSKRKKLELAEKGQPHGGRRAFGFAADGITHVPHEVAAIKSAAARVISGEPLGAIVADLNTNGPSTVTGAIWRTNAVRTILLAPRTVGLRQHQGEILGDAVWAPILDRSTQDQVRTILEDPRRRRNTFSRSYLLSGGLLRCGKCGHQLAGKPDGGRAMYACVLSNGGCGGTYLRAEQADEQIVGMVLAALESPAFRAALEAPQGEEQIETSADEAKLLELADMWDQGEITRPEWMRLRTAVEARLDAARKRMVVTRRRPVLDAYGDLTGQWETMSLHQRRAVIAEAVERIEVGPAVRGRKTYDRSRITIVWRA